MIGWGFYRVGCEPFLYKRVCRLCGSVSLHTRSSSSAYHLDPVDHRSDFSSVDIKQQRLPQSTLHTREFDAEVFFSIPLEPNKMFMPYLFLLGWLSSLITALPTTSPPSLSLALEDTSLLLKSQSLTSKRIHANKSPATPTSTA